MNIIINNAKKSLNLRQGAKSGLAQKGSLKEYNDTRNLAFRGESNPQEKTGKDKAKKAAFKALKAAAIAGAGILAYKSGKKLLNKQSQFNIEGVDFNALKKQTDGLLGKGFFEENFQKTGWGTYDNIKESTFLEDFGSTLADVPGIFLDLINTITYKTTKKMPEAKILSDRAKKVEAYESKNLILNIVKQYKNVDGSPDKFAHAIAKNINHTNPCYRTRDERVLNRLATGFVSTYYAGNDFYNITMLKKDDKDEANKSANSRMKQEGFRMILNATISFFTLGAMDKYIKNSKAGTVLSAAISALLAEIVSRKISHTPLKILSSEEAYEIAQKNKVKEKASISQKTVKTPAPSFKGSSDTKAENNIFKDFTDKDGSLKALNEMAKPQDANLNKKHKKGSKFLKALSIASILFSAYYLLNSSSKTNKYIEDFYKNTGLSDLKKLVKQKNVTVNVDELKNKLSDLSNATSANGENLASKCGADKLLDTFGNIITNLESKNEIKDGIMQTTEDRRIISGIYGGFAKMGNTIAFILSLPGRAARYGYDKLSGKKVTPPAVNEIKSQKLSVKMLDEIINDKKNANLSNEELIKEIVRNVQDVKSAELEMGDLASDCRTMVTAVSTFFFVNDYRNKVLIESEGKDKEGASAEVKERLAHKAFNFVFNGTLMNLFNQTFKKLINKYLPVAVIVAAVTEFCNENLIRFSICSPAKRMKSKEDIIEYDEKRSNNKGLLGKYTKFFKKLTGKKTIVEKANVSTKDKK